MMCYKDRTYCMFWLICKNGNTCDRAFTDDVKQAAEKAGLPVSFFAEFPECFIRWFEGA